MKRRILFCLGVAAIFIVTFGFRTLHKVLATSNVITNTTYATYSGVNLKRPTTSTSSTGVTIWTTESAMGIPNSQFGVPGVLFDLELSGSPGPNSQEWLQFLHGFTGPNGQYPWPTAVTDAYWIGFADFTLQLPNCGVTQYFTNYVPPSGALINYDCAVF